jgi:hypothetical protein
MGSQNLANLTLGGGDPREGEKNPALFALDNGHNAPVDSAVGFSTTIRMFCLRNTFTMPLSLVLKKKNTRKSSQRILSHSRESSRVDFLLDTNRYSKTRTIQEVARPLIRMPPKSLILIGDVPLVLQEQLHGLLCSS